MTWQALLAITVTGWIFAAIALVALLCRWVALLEARAADDDDLIDDLDGSDEEIAQMLAAWRNEVQR